MLLYIYIQNKKLLHIKDIKMPIAKYDYDFIDTNLDDIDISGFIYDEFFEIETLSENEIASLVDDNFIEF
jgi:hypothetical protein